MHGHGYAPPPPQPPSTGVLVVLRVIFVAVALLSIGFLAWVAPLRAAIVTRRPAEWWFFGGSVVVLGICFSLFSTDHTDDFSSPNGTLGMSMLLLNAVACAGYYLYADIRHFHRLRQAHAGQVPLMPGYGYPQPVPPFTATTAPSTPQPPYAPAPMPHAHTPAPRPPVPAPPQRPAPVRIDQVRAELDELSDYLRKHPGGQGGSHESGR
ncbi:hypothetical protein [Streptomyces broussonetiae]|uniref:Integral membrane protein n=1 Tax=Streptomyces broussonetiae TaxID=2686304 RepID=A0A6I6N0T1_9ACTN|nr:hypothetical protein [Streptomyces broussonetiae]QHA05142.1 hypothetical protein GQF42_19230 [Streptomyces broussonetiae]